MHVPSQLRIISLHVASVSSPCLLWCIKLIVIVTGQSHAYCGVTVADACALNLAAYSSDVSFGDEQLGGPPVPVNALRNRAIALAITEVDIVTVCIVTTVTAIVNVKVVVVTQIVTVTTHVLTQSTFRTIASTGAIALVRASAAQ